MEWPLIRQIMGKYTIAVCWAILMVPDRAQIIGVFIIVPPLKVAGYILPIPFILGNIHWIKDFRDKRLPSVAGKFVPTRKDR